MLFVDTDNKLYLIETKTPSPIPRRKYTESRMKRFWKIDHGRRLEQDRINVEIYNLEEANCSFDQKVKEQKEMFNKK